MKRSQLRGLTRFSVSGGQQCRNSEIVSSVETEESLALWPLRSQVYSQWLVKAEARPHSTTITTDLSHLTLNQQNRKQAIFILDNA